MQATNTRPRFEVIADGQGICSHVGAALLGELSDRLGLTSELGRRANTGVRAGAHDRGQVLRDLVVMLADGGDCISDLATLRDQPELFGQVCSTPTAWRIVAQELPDDPRGIAALWSALARVREQAWALGAAPAGPLILDLDATLIHAHSDKQGAAPTYKQGFGFHPLGCWLDRGDGTGEALGGMLRPGNAGANTAADHLDVLAMALLGLPKHARDQPILVRCDSAGATHAFVEDIVGRNLQFSIGFDCDQRVQAAILALPEQAFTPALDRGGRSRRSAWVAELSSLDLAAAGWPEGTRAICRRERPHPGAAHKLAFTDAAGHRFQVFITNQPDPDPAILEARHRPHAHVEDRIRGAKASGLRNLPFADFGANDAWLTLVMIAQTLVCWAPGPAARRRPRRRRAQGAALPAVAYRRSDRPSRPPRHRPHRSRLALGRRPGHRVRPAVGPAGALLAQPTSPAITTARPGLAGCRPRRHARSTTTPERRPMIAPVQAADRVTRIA